MPRVRFLKTIEGSSTNREGNAAGSEAHVSVEECNRLLADNAVELLADDPGPGTPPAPASPDTSDDAE